MYRFVWVENPNIDIKVEWLKVLRESGNRLLCERRDLYSPDVYIEKGEVLHETYQQLF